MFTLTTATTTSCSTTMCNSYSHSLYRTTPTLTTTNLFDRAEMAFVAYLVGPGCTTNFQGPLSCYHSNDNINSDMLAIMQQIRGSSAAGAIAMAIGVDRSSPLGVINLSTASVSFSEDRIIFSLNASHSALPQYTPGSSAYDLIAPTLGMTEHDPRLIVLNSADHSRRSRAVLTGAATPFATSGIHKCISQVGGIGAVFLLLEKARDSETLLDLLSVIAALLYHNPRCTAEMDSIRGYPILANFLYQRQALLNGAILDKVLELVGIIPDPRYPLRSPVVGNFVGFRHLVLDYELWRNTPLDVQRQYFSRISQLLVHNHQAPFNVWRFRRLHWLSRMLLILKDDELDASLLDVVMNTVTTFLKLSLEEDDIQVGLAQCDILYLVR